MQQRPPCAVSLAVLVVLACAPLLAVALENGLARTPPMGWMSWERFRCRVNCTLEPLSCIGETLILQHAERMANDGYSDAGYKYIIVDDCWMSKNRGNDSRFALDPDRWPNGMSSVSSKLHSLGLKFGLYLNFGSHTCAGYPGTFYTVQQDIEQLTGWGIDYLKMDSCLVPSLDVQPFGFALARWYLNFTGQPVVFACSWPAYWQLKGLQSDWVWAAEHCNLWRLWNDIHGNWARLLEIINYWASHSDELADAAGPGHWNDPDMLLVGSFFGPEESKTQMGMWAVLAAPLLISADLRTMPDWSKEILLNREVIAVDQDPLGKQGRLYKQPEELHNSNNSQVWARPLSDGSWAVVLFNPLDEVADTIAVSFATLGLSSEDGVHARDLFAHQDLGAFKDSFAATNVPAHGIVMVKLTISQGLKPIQEPVSFSLYQ